jgi:light-harvesting protein B-800-850 alpha chain
LFLGAVAVGSFSVHLALLNNTTWVKAFLEGGKSTKATGAATAAPMAPAAQK